MMYIYNWFDVGSIVYYGYKDRVHRYTVEKVVVTTTSEGTKISYVVNGGRSFSEDELYTYPDDAFKRYDKSKEKEDEPAIVEE